MRGGNTVRVYTLVFCAVTAACLCFLGGCYTVFQGNSLDEKPAITESVAEDDSYSGDLAFRSTHHERWNYYLTYPWWHGSVWQRHYAAPAGVTDTDHEDDSEALPDPPVYAPPLPGGSAIAPAPEQPRAVSTETTETRMKGENSTQDSTQSEAEAPAKKPGRRGGEGDPK